VTVERSCDFCGELYEAQRSSSRFCCSSCRVRSHVGETPASDVGVDAAVTALPTPAPVVGAVESATRKALEDAGKVETPLGQTALLLARDLDVSRPGATAAKASVAKQLAATLEAVTASAKPAADPLEELRKAREGARAAG
jgi:hypothetical protein